MSVEWANHEPARIASIRRRTVRGLMLATIGCGISQVQALAATGRTDAAAQTEIIRPLTAAPSAQERISSAKAGNPLWGIPLRSMSATRERPLFAPSRRPPAPPVAAAPPAPPPPSPPAPPAPPALTLVGTVLSGGERMAVFVDQGTKDVIRLRIGEGHAGWALHAIQSRAAILEQDGNKAVLALSPRHAEVQQTASVPQPNEIAPSPPPSQQAEQPPAGKWVDGDGEVINPPAPQMGISAQNSPFSSWVDGDGQRIGPPPTQVGQGAQP